MTQALYDQTISIASAFDDDRARRFAERMTGALNGAAISLMLSIGHRTGLFDCMAGLPAATSREIANAAHLDERYVREWLGAMVAGDVVIYDAADRTYLLPAEHAASLTRGMPGNLGVAAQFISVLGGVEDRIVHCFRHGGGVPYAAFGRFHEVMAEESNQSVVAELERAILPIVPGLIDRLRAGITVLDIGCGSGRAMVRLAAAFPASRFVGYDAAPEAIEAARKNALAAGVDNVRFAVRDVAALDEAAAYDLITAFDAIHDQADPATVLRNVALALRAGGTFLMQDIRGTSHVDQDRSNPFAAYLYTVSCMHCMTVSLAQGGAGLGAMWGQEQARRMLAEAGFSKVRVEQLDHDPLNDFYVCTLR